MIRENIHSNYFRKNEFLLLDSFCCKLFRTKSLNMGRLHSNCFEITTKYLALLNRILIKLLFRLGLLSQQSVRILYWHHNFLCLLQFKSIFFEFQNLSYLLDLSYLIFHTKLHLDFLFLHKVNVGTSFHFKEAQYQYHKL